MSIDPTELESKLRAFALRFQKRATICTLCQSLPSQYNGAAFTVNDAVSGPSWLIRMTCQGCGMSLVFDPDVALRE